MAVNLEIEPERSVAMGVSLPRDTLQKYISQMVGSVTGVIDHGEKRIKPTSFHPQHQVGAYILDDGEEISINSLPLTSGGIVDGRRIHIERRSPNGTIVRTEITTSDSNSSRAPHVVVFERQKDKSFQRLLPNSQGAITVAQQEAERVALLNGNIRQVSNHRGTTYKRS